MTFIKLQLALVAIVFASIFPSSILGAEGVVEFGYEALNGPTKWATLAPSNALCDTGKQQSPVNFASQDVKQNVFPSDFALPSLAQFNVSNLGHTVQFTPLDDANGDKRGMTIDGNRFSLKQFHIHTPSEHHVDNQHFEGELHFVHESADNKISVVAMFVKETPEDNPIWTDVLKSLPPNPESTVALRAVFDTAEVVRGTKNGVFTYSGSLTTPPCSEGVRWFVMSTPMTMSPAQLQTISKLIGFSARPTMFNVNVASSALGAPKAEGGKKEGASKEAGNATEGGEGANVTETLRNAAPAQSTGTVKPVEGNGNGHGRRSGKVSRRRRRRNSRGKGRKTNPSVTTTPEAPESTPTTQPSEFAQRTVLN